jgi:hypothetical protein
MSFGNGAAPLDRGDVPHPQGEVSFNHEVNAGVTAERTRVANRSVNAPNGPVYPVYPSRPGQFNIQRHDLVFRSGTRDVDEKTGVTTIYSSPENQSGGLWASFNGFCKNEEPILLGVAQTDFDLTTLAHGNEPYLAVAASGVFALMSVDKTIAAGDALVWIMPPKTANREGGQGLNAFAPMLESNLGAGKFGAVVRAYRPNALTTDNTVVRHTHIQRTVSTVTAVDDELNEMTKPLHNQIKGLLAVQAFVALGIADEEEFDPMLSAAGITDRRQFVETAVAESKAMINFARGQAPANEDRAVQAAIILACQTRIIALHDEVRRMLESRRVGRALSKTHGGNNRVIAHVTLG